MKYLLLVVFENKKTRVYFARKRELAENCRNSEAVSRVFDD